MAMDAGWSKSRISRLGKALISMSPPPAERLEELHQLLMVYDEALDVAVGRIREHTNVQTTSRLKNTGTILEKLRRSGGGSLGNIQDLAGIRIVLDCDLTEQIRFARRIEKIFFAEARPPKLVDRRFEGVRGYRAIHVIVTVDGRPVEIQIRTRLQHQWANLFEKLADIVGRGIRYGEPPDEWTVLFDVDVESPQNLVDLLVTRFEALSEEIRVCEMASTFHGNPEPFEETDPPDELPSLEEVETRKEIVLETARAIETMFS
ncbi:MAG: RelA/SpoT domain-containing protein, partial [Actinomycetota bacterium]|nr:RelA/SpoT domain-containing protein [Actinomycetota bacterium]